MDLAVELYLYEETMESKVVASNKDEAGVLVSGAVCIICGKPATRNVDGDPSCDEHIELVYEDQVEDYTLHHQANDEWLEKP